MNVLPSFDKTSRELPETLYNWFSLLNGKNFCPVLVENQTTNTDVMSGKAGHLINGFFIHPLCEHHISFLGMMILELTVFDYNINEMSILVRELEPDSPDALLIPLLHGLLQLNRESLPIGHH